MNSDSSCILCHDVLITYSERVIMKVFSAKIIVYSSLYAYAFIFYLGGGGRGEGFALSYRSFGLLEI